MNKGVGRSVEFRGLTSQYLFLFAAGMLASLLLTTFRSIDYVCRIGGDEFAIIMVKMTSDLNYTIPGKINAVNSAPGGAAASAPHHPPPEHPASDR